jgi:hypothetical protein
MDFLARLVSSFCLVLSLTITDLIESLKRYLFDWFIQKYEPPAYG